MLKRKQIRILKKKKIKNKQRNRRLMFKAQNCNFKISVTL